MINTVSSLFAESARTQLAVQRLPEILSVLLIIGSTYTLANITWDLYPQNKSSASTSSFVADAKHTQKPNSSQLFRALSNAHLFGIASNKTQTTTKAPITKLNLVLKGVLAAIPTSLATAIIARKKNGPEEIYAIGDRLPGNVTIKEIHADHVIIDRGGQLETLRLQKDRDIPGFSHTSRSYVSPASSGIQSLKDIRNQIIRDPTSFAEYALPILVKEKGKQIGYRLDLQAKGGAFKKAGLKPTDVIIAINGIKLDTPKNSMRALRKIRTSTRLDLTIRRNGRDVKLNLRLQ